MTTSGSPDIGDSALASRSAVQTYGATAQTKIEVEGINISAGKGNDTVTIGATFPLTGVAAPGYSEIPTGAQAYFGKDVTEVDLLEAFARHLLAWVNTWLDRGFRPVREAWLRHAQGLGDMRSSLRTGDRFDQGHRYRNRG